MKVEIAADNELNARYCFYVVIGLLVHSDGIIFESLTFISRLVFLDLGLPK